MGKIQIKIPIVAKDKRDIEKGKPDCTNQK